MPPPNGFPGQQGETNPHVQQFMQMVMQAVHTTVQNVLTEQLQQHLHQVNQTISPAGRKVVVNRMNPNNPKQFFPQENTTPQLLAELCDHLIQSNKLMKKSLKRSMQLDDDD
jgi:hypothetical protein